EAEHVDVEPACAVDVRCPQMDVPDRDAGVDRPGTTCPRLHAALRHCEETSPSSRSGRSRQPHAPKASPAHVSSAWYVMPTAAAVPGSMPVCASATATAALATPTLPGVSVTRLDAPSGARSTIARVAGLAAESACGR